MNFTALTNRGTERRYSCLVKAIRACLWYFFPKSRLFGRPGRFGGPRWRDCLCQSLLNIRNPITVRGIFEILMCDSLLPGPRVVYCLSSLVDKIMQCFSMFDPHFRRIARWGCRCLVLALLISLAGCQKDDPPAVAKPPDVRVMTVALQDVPVYQEWIGSLDGYVNAQIRAQVSGYLLSQNYKEGSFVKKGDVLFQIDPRPFEATLEQTKGQLGMAVAQQGRTDLDVARFTPLVKSNAMTQEELDDAVQSSLAAKANVTLAEAVKKQAELNLEFTRVISPIDGIAGIARAQIGDLVGPGSGNLTEVSTVDPIKVYITVTEQYYLDHLAGYLSNGDGSGSELDLELVLANGSVYPHKGKFYFLDRQVEPGTGAIKIAVLFPNPGNLLRPGQYARIRARTETRKDVVVIPQKAVTELQGSFQVDVVTSSNLVAIRQVTVGTQISNRWVIEDGLKSGDLIIVDGLQKAVAGKAVNPLPLEQPAPAKG
jgi:membrane fusion protein (multidrug efflux system)